MSDRDRRVRDEAYRIWDEAGRPSGRDEEHWHEAERRVGAAEAEKGSRAGKPKSVKPVVKGEGVSGVAVAVADDQPKSKAKKGDPVDIVASPKPKKAKAAAAAKPGKDKADKGAKAKSKP